MFGLTRFSILTGLVVLAGIVMGITVGIAQTLPRGNGSQEKIRRALEGDDPVDETGDVVLDDILSVIKERGSILDGSSLDPATEGTSALEEVRPVPQSKRTRSTHSEKAEAAEWLLRASRKLEEIQPLSKSRREMVKKMRGEAVKLLSE